MVILALTDRSLVAEARRQAVQLATDVKLDETGRGRIALITTELSTNLIKHAPGGEIVIGTFDDADGAGVEVLSLDKGPGIADLQRALTDGFSTAGSAGTGLGAARRAADVFSAYSRAGGGTAIVTRVRKADAASAARFEIGSVCAPYPGELVCGDGWAVRQFPNRLVVMMADGLGHGMLAHDAAERAKVIFTERAEEPIEGIAESLHRGLAPTRGAAIAVSEIDLAARRGYAPSITR
jgi:anti-sigma regulatory factor (Ser/Thr protein kinase)